MATNSDKSAKMIQRLRLVAVLVVTFIAVVVVRWLWTGALSEALSAALDAVFIAAFLALTVDPFLKKEFFVEASTDIFFFWLGYYLPREVSEYLQDFVMDTKLLRRNCVLAWTLKDLADGQVELELDVSFEFQNVTNQYQQYQQGGHLFPTATKERVLQMRCNAPGYKELEYVFEAKDFQTSPDGWVLGPACTIPPQRVLEAKTNCGNNSITFGIKYSSVHGQSGNDTWKTAKPTVNLTVVCRPAERFLFSLDLNGAVLTEPGSWHWEGIMLQNQGVSVSWTRV
jgi:hypothetical protein